MRTNTMKTSKRRVLAVGLALFVASVAVVVVRPVTASAATVYTWNGGTSANWATAANWTPNGIPVAGDLLVFPTPRVASNFDMIDDLAGAQVKFDTITFNAPGYSVTPSGAQTIGAIDFTDTSVGGGNFIDIPVEFDQPAQVTASGAGHTLLFNVPGNTSNSPVPGINFIGPGVIEMAWGNPGIVDPVNIDGDSNAVVLDNAATGLGSGNTITLKDSVVTPGAGNGQLRFGVNETVANPIVLFGTGPGGTGAIETLGGATVTLSGPLTINDSTVFAPSLSHLALTGALTGGGALTINGPSLAGGFVSIAGSSSNAAFIGTVSVDNAELDLNHTGGTAALAVAAVFVGSAGGINDHATLNFLGAVDQLTTNTVLSVNPLGTATTDVDLHASTHETVHSLALGPAPTGVTTGVTKLDASGTTKLVVSAGPVWLGGATLNQTLASTPPAGTPFDIIANPVGVDPVGTFAGHAEGSTYIVGGTVLTISYVGALGGHSVTLTPAAAPPPPPPVVDTLAVRGADNGLWVHTNTPGYQGYGGQLLAAPAIASLGNGDHLYVVLGTDHQLYQRTDHVGYQVAGAPGTYCLDNPALYVNGGNATIACMGGDHQLFVDHGTVDIGGVFHPGVWLAAGGYLSSGPSVALVLGHLHYFVEGRNHIVYDNTDGTAYAATPWACIGHQGVANFAGQAYFTCHGTDGRAWAAVNPGTGWSDAQPLGGQLVDGTAVAAHAGGATLFAEGVGHGAWSISVPTNGNAAGGWSSLGGQCNGGTGAST